MDYLLNDIHVDLGLESIQKNLHILKYFGKNSWNAIS